MSSLQIDDIHPWEVWLMKWHHPDHGYKYRPGLVLDVLDDSVLALKLTSSKNVSFPGDYELGLWEQAGLKRPTIARTSQIKNVRLEYIASRKPFGRLADRDVASIMKLIEG